MTSFLDLYRKILRFVGYAERTLGVALILAIVLSILSQVYYRYILDRPLIWVLEASVNCFIWSTFLGISYGLKLDRHITINTFVHRLPQKLRNLMLSLIHLAVLLASIALAYHAFQVIGVESKTPTVSLPVLLPKSLFFSVPVFCCAVLMIFTSVYNILSHFRAFSTGNDAEPIYA